MALTLYYHPLSSFCHKVLIALYELDIEFDKRLVNLGEPDDRAELGAIWPLLKFPVLRDSERQRYVAETSIIIEYLDQSHHRLIPIDWDVAMQVRLWDRVCDNHLQGPLQAIVRDRIMGVNSPMAQERAVLHTVYAMLEKTLEGRDWLGGGAFSMADCAAAPALFYTFTLEGPQDMPRLQAYYERLMARPSVSRVLEEAKPWLHMYPFAEAIPARFR